MIAYAFQTSIDWTSIDLLRPTEFLKLGQPAVLQFQLSYTSACLTKDYGMLYWALLLSPHTTTSPFKEQWNLWQVFFIHCNYQQNESVLNDSNNKNKLYTNVSCIHKLKGFKHMWLWSNLSLIFLTQDSAHILSLVL